MELREKYIHAISRSSEMVKEESKEDAASIDDMKFALEFLNFSGRKDASPREIAAVAKVAEFYRKYYSSGKEMKREEISETKHIKNSTLNEE